MARRPRRLFYGSCLREKQLDGLMLDFYLIVSAIARLWCRLDGARQPADPANRLPFQDGKLAAKYAVLSEKDFCA
jgi:hypothetical protein